MLVMKTGMDPADHYQRRDVAACDLYGMNGPTERDRGTQRLREVMWWVALLVLMGSILGLATLFSAE